MKYFKIFFPVTFFSIFAFNQAVSQQTKNRKIENVIYGMASGTALLMDVYTAANPKHKAIIFIPGSAWGFPYPQNYDQPQLKDDVIFDSNYVGKWIKALVQDGFTVFVINHRFTPQFHYRDIIKDCERAVKYVRYNAKEFNIDPNHIGAMGHSSGANLVSMLGVKDDDATKSKSPVDSVSSKVQAVVTLAAPFDLSDINQMEDSLMANNYILAAIDAYMDGLPALKNGAFILSGKYADASPYSFVTKDDAPALIFYSDNDPVIATRQAKKMYEKLQQNNIPSKLIVSHKAGHEPIPDMKVVGNWFDQYLK